MFKEFGVRLHFTPTILGTDLINLKVRPEVSSLDFSNAITLNGFRVPALSSRRTETEVELQDGQTFAIAGLMNNTLNSTMDKIPGIGDIPVLGYLFRSRAYQKNQTELVVMITPQILRRGANGVSSGLPAAVEPFLGAPRRTVPQPPPYVGSPVYPAGGRSGGAPSGRTEPEPSASAPVSAPAAPVSAPAVPVPAPVQPAVESASAAAPAAPVTTPAPAAEVTTPPAPKPDRKAAAREREAQKQAAAAQKAADKKAAQEKAAADKKAAEEKAVADKKAAAEKAIADKKAEIAQARQQKLDEDRAKRDAEVAKKTAEEDRKKADEQQKHDKLLLDAAARLKAAQAAYQAELDKKKGLQ